MIICVIGLRGFPNVAGGIETHCGYLYPRLAALRPDDRIFVCGRSRYIGKQRYEPAPGVTVVPVAAIDNKYLETISNTFLALLVARFRLKADVVHLHAIGPGLLAPMAVLLGMKVVLTHHGDDFRRAKWNRFAKAVLRLGEGLGVRWATRTLAVSKTVAERLRAKMPSRAAAIHYIPNGADHILGEVGKDPQAPERFGLRKGNYVVSVGRLVPEKAFANLIRAHRDSGIDRPLVIIGGDKDSKHGQELEALAGPDVVMAGNQPPETVAALVGSAGLFVLASYHEGLPIAALEAVALGTPVLLSDIPANLGVGMPPAHYYPVDDVAALSDRLRGDAFELPVVALSDRFRWQGIAEETSRHYDQLT